MSSKNKAGLLQVGPQAVRRRTQPVRRWRWVEEEGGQGGGRVAGHSGRRGQEGEGGVVVVELGMGGRGRTGAKERVAAAGRGPGGRQAATVHVQPGVLFLPLGPPVLEPDLHLQKVR